MPAAEAENTEIASKTQIPCNNGRPCRLLVRGGEIGHIHHRAGGKAECRTLGPDSVCGAAEE